MNKRLLAIPVLALAASACSTYYDVEPVVSENDQRVTEVPDFTDNDAVEDQDCFKITLKDEDGLGTDKKDVGIACIVTPAEEGEG
jgi:hypothetical protein